jgi:2-dehydropantoate 2-reductase
MGIRYGIIGTGALGGFYGGMLAKTGHEVHFLVRSDYEFIRKNGLRVDSIYGDFHLREVNVYQTADEMPKCDVLLVCMKTTGNNRLAEILKPVIHSKSVVVLLQNGLGLEADLANALPKTSIAGGLAFICSNKVGPGHIAHLDFGNLIIGSHNIVNCEILEKIITHFQLAGINAELAPDLEFARWQKLIWNIPFNGLTVVLNTTTDKLMANESTRKLCHELMLEVIHGANACGFSLKDSLAKQMIEMTIKMKPYAPSMKLDYDYKRPMEIEYIYSKPIQAALDAGFDMRKVSMLENQLRFIRETQVSKT